MASSSNTITYAENTPLELERLRARSYLLGRAQQLFGLQTILSVPGATASALLTIIFPDIALLMGLVFGLIVPVIIAAIIEPFIASYKEKAYKIQELFDCEILVLPWHEAHLGSPPLEVDIARAAAKHPSTEGLRNWHQPLVSSVDLRYGRWICQFTNVWWTKQLRADWNSLVWAMLVIGCLVALVVGALGNFSVPKLVTGILIPFLPLALWTIQELHRLRQSAENMQRIVDLLDKLWKDLLDGLGEAEAVQRSRDIQDEIYDYRRHNTLVFRWFYERNKASYHAAISKETEDRVKQVPK